MSGLDKETEQKIRSTLASFEAIDKAILYGSRAKGNQKQGSDIDLALFGAHLTQSILFGILDALDELYLPYTFDLTIYCKIHNPDLREHIQRVGKVFFERTPSTAPNNRLQKNTGRPRPETARNS